MLGNVVKKGKATEKKAVIKKDNSKTVSNKKITKAVVKKEQRKDGATKNNINKSSKFEIENNKRNALKTAVNKDEKLNEKKEYLQEYYDLPYRYNETIVTILAQTPKRLFVYWDISDKDKENYKKVFGNDFFEKTYPVLLVHNEELNYTFEVPINDFANSWYLDIKDSKKNYVVKLGRKFKNIGAMQNINYDVLKQENINLKNDFVYITASNKLEAPNDHILFELLSSQVTYRNVKTGNEFKKELKDLVNESNTMFPKEVAQELYAKMYSEEMSREEFSLPTSSGSLRSSGQW